METVDSAVLLLRIPHPQWQLSTEQGKKDWKRKEEEKKIKKELERKNKKKGKEKE